MLKKLRNWRSVVFEECRNYILHAMFVLKYTSTQLFFPQSDHKVSHAATVVIKQTAAFRMQQVWFCLSQPRRKNDNYNNDIPCEEFSGRRNKSSWADSDDVWRYIFTERTNSLKFTDQHVRVTQWVTVSLMLTLIGVKIQTEACQISFVSSCRKAVEIWNFEIM